MPQDFFSEYLAYASGNEVPTVFHRWSAIGIVAAILERNIYVPFSDTKIYPNIYLMLMGVSGTRKSTAINMATRILALAGYKTFAAEKTSKEKFLADLARQNEAVEDDDAALFGPVNGAVTPILIAADEANDFFGIGNLEFLSMLGSLWANPDKYENKTKTVKSDWISNPTITILSGNTPTNFSLAFPASIIGQGFFSRLLLIHGEPTHRKIRRPKIPTNEEKAYVAGILQAIKSNCIGMYEYTSSAHNLLDAIYADYSPPNDPRFESYGSRRLQHLEKLCLIISAGKLDKEITESSVLQANTYLTYVESLMPKALGEFGKAKNSDIVDKVMTIIYNAPGVIGIKDIWMKVKQDLEQPKDLGQIISSLQFADKIQTVQGGFLPLRAVEEVDEGGKRKEKYTDFGMYLTQQELEIKK